MELTTQGVSDEQIAEQLTQKEYRFPRTPRFLTSTVRNIRLKHRILITPSQSHPRHIPNYLTVPQLAQRLGLPLHWVYDGIKKRRIQILKDPQKHVYLFPDKPKTIEDLLKLKNGKVQKVIF